VNEAVTKEERKKKEKKKKFFKPAHFAQTNGPGHSHERGKHFLRAKETSDARSTTKRPTESCSSLLDPLGMIPHPRTTSCREPELPPAPLQHRKLKKEVFFG
jgi:hypothetical protein